MRYDDIKGLPSFPVDRSAAAPGFTSLTLTRP